MNNRGKRLEYLSRLNNNKFTYFNEEIFIINVVKNEYAMNYVYKKFNLIEDIDKVVNFDISQKYNYNFIAMVAACQERINEMGVLLTYIAYAEETNQLELIEAILKKSFSKIYKEFKNNTLKLESSIEQNNIILFLLSFYNESFDSLTSEAKECILEAGYIAASDCIIHNIIEDNIMNDSNLIEIINKYKLNKPTSLQKILFKIREDYIEDFTDFLKKKGYEESEVRNLILETFDGNDILEKEFLSSKKYKSIEAYKHSRYICEMLERFTIEKVRIENETLPINEIKAILSNLNVMLNSQFLNIKDSEIFFLNNFLFYILFKKLNINTEVLSKTLIDNHNQKSLSNKEKFELQDKILLLKKEKEENVTILNNKELELKSLKKELEVAKATINSLNDEVYKLKDNKEELNNLRELFFNLEQHDNNIITNNTSFTIKDEWKIAFVGGSDTLRSKIKEYFPSFICISPDDLTKDLTFLRSMDYIFIHTHMSHSMYYKVIDMIRFNKINFSFLNEINLELLKNNILNKLNNTLNKR